MAQRDTAQQKTKTGGGNTGKGRHPNSLANLQKGRKKTRKGKPNKVSKGIAEDILDAWNELGGKEYLLKLAKSKRSQDRAMFIQLVQRVIPRELNATMTHEVDRSIIEALQAGRQRVADMRARQEKEEGLTKYYGPKEVDAAAEVVDMQPETSLRDIKMETNQKVPAVISAKSKRK